MAGFWRGGTQQIVGRERRGRLSQLAWCGEGCFDSRRRVNSDVKRRAARRRPKGSRRASSSIFKSRSGCAPINDRELFPTRLRTGVAARRLTTRWSGHRSAAAPHSRARKVNYNFPRQALGGAAQLAIVMLLLSFILALTPVAQSSHVRSIRDIDFKNFTYPKLPTA